MQKVVYIGCFNQIPGARNGPKLKEDTQYICYELIDRFRDYIEMEYDTIPEIQKKQVELKFSNARHTRLKDETIDEVHMYNILGDPNINDIDEFLIESRRILKSEKSLYVGETNTPYAIENLINMTRKNKFSIHIIVPQPQITEKELARFYEIMAENITKETYNKNFNEWYTLLESLNLITNYKLNNQEKKIIEEYKGTGQVLTSGYRGIDQVISLGSYLVRLDKV